MRRFQKKAVLIDYHSLEGLDWSRQVLPFLQLLYELHVVTNHTVYDQARLLREDLPGWVRSVPVDLAGDPVGSIYEWRRPLSLNLPGSALFTANEGSSIVQSLRQSGVVDLRPVENQFVR